ncbi:protein NEOXANTHIN-DEFICIENT 1 isoform X4 [Rosa chinensis]|uniref:protein NEOXANTHIN-DEFICIENT 1 isoform X4 n=1 Tax=Rosa chinensis TaxID=74649 RepID=UPI001AD8A13D|nr:protein NEOXANTHIN-DEFICIENT 1 isoform X4 [Rosa chinensis]
MWKKQNVPSSTASLRGFSKAGKCPDSTRAVLIYCLLLNFERRLCTLPWLFVESEHCINSIWSRQRLFEHASLKSSDWLKHLDILLAGFFLLTMMTAQLEFLMRWAAKVLVNSKEACDHGRKEVGLPSQVARFSKRITAVSRKPKTKQSEFLNLIGMEGGFSDPGEQVNVQVTEIMGQASKDTCNVNLTTFVPALDINKWMGPAIKMSLPSFSGRTEYYPDLLKYSCQIDCRVRVVHPAKVSGPSPVPSNENENKQCSEIHSCNTQNQATKEFMDNEQNLTRAVMLSKPILALEFSSMKMQVEAPVVVSNYFKNSLATS